MGSVYWKAGICAILGCLGGALAYFIASPFLGDIASQNVHPNYTLGSVFGWLSHGLLGAFIVAPISAMLGYDESGFKGAWISGGVGLLLGAGAGYGSDALYDWLMIRSNARSIGISLHLLWSLFVCGSLALAIFLATGAKGHRLLRCLAAAGISTILGEFARQAVASTLATGMLMNALQNPSSIERGDKWVRLGPSMLAGYCVIGIVLGAVFGLVEALMKPARLRRLLGVKEWMTWSLTENSYRIGSAEDVEIRISDGRLNPIHAYLVRQNRQYCIQEAGADLVVNGMPTSAHWLSDGDLIHLGDSMFFFGEGAPPAPSKSIGASPQKISSSKTDLRLSDSFGNIYNLKQGSQIVGRDATADISLAWDEKVSRRHAEVRVDQDQVTVSDLGSRNGTTVQGLSIQGATLLTQGAKIQVGSTILTYLS